MANLKISALPPAVALDGTEQLAGVQKAGSVSILLSQVMAFISSVGVSLLTTNVFQKNQSVNMVEVPDAATITLDVSKGNNFEIYCSAGVGTTRTIAATLNPTAGMVINIMIEQNNTAPTTIIWDPSFRGPGGVTPPAASTTANAVDLYSFIYSGGNQVWYGGMIKGS